MGRFYPHLNLEERRKLAVNGAFKYHKCPEPPYPTSTFHVQ